MKYLPIIGKIDQFFGNSVFGHVVLFKTMEFLLPRTWHLKREIYKWAREHQGHQHMLDAGSGLGQYAYLLSSINKKWSVVGIDLNQKQVAHCNKVFRKLGRTNVLFKSSDLLNMNTPRCYNLILATDLAEYVEDDDELFKSFADGLQPGGILLMYAHVVDAKNPDARRTRMKLVEEQFRNGYALENLKDKLKTAGFKKVKIRLVFGLAGRISWYLSVFYPLKMLNASFALIALLPFYYLLTVPITFVLNYIDTHTAHLTGSAMLVTASKN